MRTPHETEFEESLGTWRRKVEEANEARLRLDKARDRHVAAVTGDLVATLNAKSPVPGLGEKVRAAIHDHLNDGLMGLTADTEVACTGSRAEAQAHRRRSPR